MNPKPVRSDWHSVHSVEYYLPESSKSFLTFLTLPRLAIPAASQGRVGTTSQLVHQVKSRCAQCSHLATPEQHLPAVRHLSHISQHPASFGLLIGMIRRFSIGSSPWFSTTLVIDIKSWARLVDILLLNALSEIQDSSRVRGLGWESANELRYPPKTS